MSFKRRNVVISTNSASDRTPSSSLPNPVAAAQAAAASSPDLTSSRTSSTLAATFTTQPQSSTHTPIPGVRPSSLSGIPTISTGTPTLDSLLSGHSGLPLGSSLFIEENSTADFAGALLRYYAAEGIVQGHKVIIVGGGEAWAKQLPGISGIIEDDGTENRKAKKENDRMKIAWRYEGLGQFGSQRAPAQTPSTPTHSSQLDTNTASATSASNLQPQQQPFCHTYDLTKRLTIPPSNPPILLSLHPTNLFSPLLQSISSYLTSSTATITRLVIPNLLSPLLYPPSASSPSHILQFLHSLRSLLRQYSHQLTIMISFPLALYPRSSGLVRWIELLMDCVVELTPIPVPEKKTTNSVEQDDVPQGLVKIWKAIEGKAGGGLDGMGMAGGDDMAFTVSRRRFKIAKYSLPPADEEDNDDDGNSTSSKGGGGGKIDPSAVGGEVKKKPTKMDIDF